MATHLLVAHFAAGPRSQELRCSRAHCASTVVLRFSISVPFLSQSHRMSPPTSISARRRRRRIQILQELSGPLHRRERAHAGSRNMKVDRIGALHNSYVCTRCLRVRHLANRFNSRRRQTSLRAPLDCRGGSVWVGSALKKVSSTSRRDPRRHRYR